MNDLMKYNKYFKLFSRNNQQDATLQQNLLFHRSLKAQHVSSGTQLIIRSSGELYLQPLVYIRMWWPAVNKS